MGANDEEAVLVTLLRCSLIALVIAVVILLFQYPIHKLGFTILSGTSEIESSGLDYFNARFRGAQAVILYIVLIGWFLGSEMIVVEKLM